MIPHRENGVRPRFYPEYHVQSGSPRPSLELGIDRCLGYDFYAVHAKNKHVWFSAIKSRCSTSFSYIRYIKSPRELS